MNTKPVCFFASVPLAACALFSFASPAVAQSPFVAVPSGGPPTVDQRRAERTANRDKSQKMWDSWRGPLGGGHDALAEIAALQSLRPNKENVNSVLTAMRSKGPNGEDKAMLARIAGAMGPSLSIMLSPVVMSVAIAAKGICNWSK